MFDDKNLGAARHNSTSGGKKYYQSIDELLASDSNGFKLLTGKVTKDSISLLDFLFNKTKHRITPRQYSFQSNQVKVLTFNYMIS